MTNPITASDPIIGPARGDPETAVAWAVGAGAKRLDQVQTYIAEVYRLAPTAGIDPAIVVSQAALESGDWGSLPGKGGQAWVARLNPASTGITSNHEGDPDHDLGYSWPDGAAAARAHLAHLWAYTKGALPPWTFWNPRVALVLTGPNAGTVRTIDDLAGTYARTPNYGQRVADRGNLIFDGFKETPTMPTKPKILLTRGHGTTGDTGAFAGGQSEEVHNKRIVPAVAAALRGGGYSVTTFPSNPYDDVPGTLDTEAGFARRWCADLKGATGVMLDSHLESSSARGIFGIVANDIGLSTAAPGAQPLSDTYAGNPGDVALCKAIVGEISRLTGVPIRTGWVKEPGVMSEDMTYVGGLGWRLAMFGYTAEFHANVYRLVIEFANLQHDAAFYTRPDFPERCGQGVALAMNRVFGVADEPGTPTTPPLPRYAAPKPIAALARLDAGDRAGLDAVSLKEGGSFTVFRREVEAVRATPRYQIANVKSTARVGPDIRQGERFVPAWKFTAADGTEWYLSNAWTRIKAADVAVVDETPAQAA